MLENRNIFSHEVFFQIQAASKTRIIPAELLTDRSPTFSPAPVDFGVKQDQTPFTTHEQPASRTAGKPATCVLLPAPPHCAILCKTLLMPQCPILHEYRHVGLLHLLSTAQGEAWHGGGTLRCPGSRAFNYKPGCGAIISSELLLLTPVS